ncbi:MAG: hypothetical protein CYPHOPRED_001331 [Cyphobasidiales sp. Tagirdzhanova-0007]|nr:MAG: hypothetical protein CYPHOPRED_001331 [Cyphobasidiales sp. Tagirdzhanova-0007]
MTHKGKERPGVLSSIYRRTSSSNADPDAPTSAFNLPQYSPAPWPSPRFGHHDSRHNADPSNYNLLQYGRKHGPFLAWIGLLLLASLFLLSSWKSVYRHDPGTESTRSLDPTKASEGTLALPSLTNIELNPNPNPRLPSGDPNEKFMAYFPHSVSRLILIFIKTIPPDISSQGYHNQRISLENALAVAKLLDRTLLVPPVWLGHAIPYISFDKLYDRLLQARKTGLEHCKTMPLSYPVPQECLGGYWDYTIVSWDFLVNMGGISAYQPIVDRWDTSYAWLESNLGIHKDRDIYFIKDERLYEYRIFDSSNDTEVLDKFEKRLRIDELRSASKDYRLIHFGSLFGTLRLQAANKESFAARSLARQFMVFRNPFLDGITDSIQHRLGGSTAYLGIHLRLGDGVFRKDAVRNSKSLFVELCKRQLGLSDELVNGLMEESRRLHEAGGALLKRDNLDQAASSAKASQKYPQQQTLSKATGLRSRSRRARVDPQLALPPLPNITSRSTSTLHSSLSCRGEYHADPRLIVLNTPLFLATDSKIPSSDPALRLFFDTFPCTFILSDFSNSQPTIINQEPIVDLRNLDGLINKEDGVPLAGFLYPLVDAMVAAKGRDMLGTPGSTFSRFAVDVLHQVYHGWPIVERG